MGVITYHASWSIMLPFESLARMASVSDHSYQYYEILLVQGRLIDQPLTPGSMHRGKIPKQLALSQA